MNTRPRLLLGSFVSAGSRMTKTTNSPTHYETLDVNPRATQGEIKSAYFRLSKEYHPDRNASEAATAKFRDITEAYEVLGSFTSRKIYDRSILTHTRRDVPRNSSNQDDPRMKQYQAQAAVFRDHQKSGSTPVYDFDAWTKAHYGRTLHRTFRDKAFSQEMRRSNEDIRYMNANFSDLPLTITAVIVITFLLTAACLGHDYDEPTLYVPARDALDKSQLSENNSTENNAPRESLLKK